MAESELSELKKHCIASITSLYVCADNVFQYLDDEKEEELEKLKSYVEKYCLLDDQRKVAIEALEKAKEGADASNIGSLQKKFDSYLSSLAKKKCNTVTHPFMNEFNNRLAKGRKTANMNESDLAITETQEQFIDPITKKRLVDPVRNKMCSHVYERSTILAYISTKKRCPVVGCGYSAQLTESDLVPDEDLMFRLTLTQSSTMRDEQSILDSD